MERYVFETEECLECYKKKCEDLEEKVLARESKIRIKKEKQMIFKATPLFTPEQREMIETRSGNPKSLTFPCDVTPKSVKHLRNADPNTGHDLHLNGLPLLVDFVASKRLRVLLLARYGKFIDVVSSASLMHRPDLSDTSVDDTPSTFRYGMSVMMNLRIIKKMCAELCTIRHIDEEIDEFVIEIEKTLIDYGVTIPEPLPVETFENAQFKLEKAENKQRFIVGCGREFEWQYDFLKLNIWFTNLSIYEQLLRYNSGILIPNPDYDALFQKDYKIGGRFFCFAVLMTKEQAQIIINQRENHKLEDWRVICANLKDAL